MKIVLIQILLFIFFISSSSSQEIKEFYVECDEAEFAYMYENYDEEIFVNANLNYNNSTWTNLRLRIRGDGSREYPKKSLKLFFDDEPFSDGRDVLNFNAEYKDKGYLHSVLSSIVFKKAGLDCIDIEHVRLYLNGDFFGLYVLIENMDNLFLENRNYNLSGNLYKATLDGACLSIFDNVFYHWEKKVNGTSGIDDLQSLIEMLNNTHNNQFPEFLNLWFDYNQITSLIALNMLLANGSTYYHNYYLFNDIEGSGRWIFMPWDLDLSFSAYTKWYSYHRSSGDWTADNPILEKSIINDYVFADIIDHISLLKNSIFNQNYLFPIIDSICNTIEASVAEDITDNVLNVDEWLESVEEDKIFITQRFSELMYQMNNIPRNFEIHRHSGYYLPGQQIILSWNESSDPNGDALFYTLFYGQSSHLNDSTTTIIQGITNNSFTITENLEQGRYYFKVEVTDGNYSIPGFDTKNIFFVSDEIPEIIINEINYNSSDEFDPGDWVEFYNPTAFDADLSGWQFKDENDQHNYTFPAGITIAPDSYLVLCRDDSSFYSVFPDSIPVVGNMDFGFSSSGELIRLYHKTGYLVDSLVYDNKEPWPTEPDGEGPTIELLNPLLQNEYGQSWKASSSYGTPGSINSAYSPETEEEKIIKNRTICKNFPNPIINQLNVEYETNQFGEVKLQLFNLLGILVNEIQMFKTQSGRQQISLKTQDIDAGVYIYKLIINEKVAASRRVIKIEN